LRDGATDDATAAGAFARGLTTFGLLGAAGGFATGTVGCFGDSAGFFDAVLIDFFEDFVEDFLAAFFAPAFFFAFLPDFFAAGFFTAFFIFLAGALFAFVAATFLARFFDAALAAATFAFFFFEGFFLVATANSFVAQNGIIGIDRMRQRYRVASASIPNTEKTSGFRSRL
jgi:hypothetical protein